MMKYFKVFLLLLITTQSFAAGTLGYSEWKIGTVAATSVTTNGGTTQATGSTFTVYTVYRRTSTGGTAPLTVVDNKSNTYTLRRTLAYAFGFASSSIYDCINCTGGAGHTVTATWDLGNDLASVTFIETAELGAATFISAPTGLEDNDNSPVPAPAITTTVADSVVLGMFACYGTNTQTITSTGSGYSVAASQGTSGGAPGAVAWKLAATGGSQVAGFTYTTNDYCGSMAVGYQPSSGVISSGGKPFLAF